MDMENDVIASEAKQSRRDSPLLGCFVADGKLPPVCRSLAMTDGGGYC
ncbi:MAG: hypothetical protein LBT00_02880 [Spirochaetaceae bacterium]|nr:hypothetical protein [Spirochaetaceae bacterium]